MGIGGRVHGKDRDIEMDGERRKAIRGKDWCSDLTSDSEAADDGRFQTDSWCDYSSGIYIRKRNANEIYYSSVQTIREIENRRAGGYCSREE